ncbi:alpha/beta hydrolase [Bacillus siamensis]|uniref:alpha/beta fold hydrolase n=1 Tax=Bacillus siamensis TaxID=659243 RepID=UPI002E2400C3|nr:alpha/beta hydrolase [Bacillus siamensis]MED0777679.1 alpha/beta hydrolase [Bacillus siamensis]MED0781546.1 alpha/beta hydrolase [Bacillus siamensis]MED0836391.1 alpha/beta hydrolase [Bacillus siamensis]
MNDITFHMIETNGVTLHTASAGPKDGPLAVLLHGFPEFWYGWKSQIKPLADAGYHVVVPDQRGYNLSDKPEGIENYTIDKLRDDISGLITHFTDDKAVVIGHDWGGAVAWHLASTRPQYVEKLITVNIPHPAVMRKVTPFYPPQWKKSSYIAFFQLPEKPERRLSEDDYRVLDHAIGLSERPELFSREDVDSYKEAWGRKGALTAMLNWYRAIRCGGLGPSVPLKMSVPYRLIWGVNDRALSKKLASETKRMIPNGDLIFIDDASHWVIHEKPRIVSHLIHEYLQQ